MRQRVWLTALVLLGAWAASSAGETRPAQRAAGDEKAEAKDKGIPNALAQAASRSFVKIHYHFKKDLSERAGRSTWAGWRARQYERYVDDKITLDASGVVIAPGVVLTYDNGLEDRFIDRIEVVTASGKRYAARRDKLLDRCSGQTLKVNKPGADLAGLTFAKVKPVTLATTFWSAGLTRDGDRWRLTYSGLTPAHVFAATSSLVFASAGDRPSAGAHSFSDLSDMDCVQVIADQKGRPLGVCVDDLFDARQDLSLWQGADLRRADGLTRQQIDAKRQALRAALLKSVHEVKVKFRQGSQGRDAQGVEGREISLYCLAVTDRRAIIPSFFSRKIAAQIDRIDIKYSPTRRARCRFAGAYKDFGAAVIELVQGAFPGHVALGKADPPRMRPLWAVSAREKNGRTDVDITLTRLLGKERGYRNRFHWTSARGLPGGTFLITMDGALAGIYMRQRVENEEQRQLESSGSSRYGNSYYDSSVIKRRIFAIAEIRDALLDPAKALDAKIKVMPKLLAKRRHWLGVEYAGMTRDLAEQMKLEKPTRDGTIGFLVSAVYAGSPARTMGLAVGDVLLRLEVKGQPYPLELKSTHAGRDERDRYYGSGEDDEGPAAPSWKNRANFLTKVLDAIGAGKDVKVTYYDADAKGNKIVSKTFTVRRAPPDFDSARRWKNRKIGLTVKDLTYEIRTALSLSANAPGVVVARIEPGSPANVARIWSNEIITAADDKPVTSAKALCDAIASAKKAKKDKVRLTILRLGRTRFADLTVKAYDSADDEGLDED